jgi:hypothetical protein
MLNEFTFAIKSIKRESFLTDTRFCCRTDTKLCQILLDQEPKTFLTTRSSPSRTKLSTLYYNCLI